MIALTLQDHQHLMAALRNSSELVYEFTSAERVVQDSPKIEMPVGCIVNKVSVALIRVLHSPSTGEKYGEYAGCIQGSLDTPTMILPISRRKP